MQSILELVFILVVLCINFASLEEIGSPLRTAQCRATCVNKFSLPYHGHRDRCPKSSQCGICWDTCRHHSSPFSNCTQALMCGPGCEAACKFMDSSGKAQRMPVQVRRGEEVLKIQGEMTRWPAPAPELEGPWVYLVMRRLNGAWRQIKQTLDLSARIPAGGMVRVLVVGKDGLVTIYGPEEEGTASASNPEVGLPEGKGWHLREVSVIHQEAVVIAELAWEARHPRALYLVTWEVAGGGLRGNLLTSSTCVALSLWPDTQFHVQVELMAPELLEMEDAKRKSEELVIDTRRSAEMEVLIDTEDDSEGEQVHRDVGDDDDDDDDDNDDVDNTKDNSNKDDIDSGAEYGEEREKSVKITESGSVVNSNSLYSVIKITKRDSVTGADLQLMVAGAASALFLFALLLSCLFCIRRRQISLEDKYSQLNTPIQDSLPTISLVMVPPADVPPSSRRHKAVT